MKILFTGGGGAVYEAVYRLWHERYDMHFVGANPDAVFPELPRDRCHSGPPGNDAAFASATATLCKKLKVGLLVPAVDEELPHAMAVARLATGLALMLPDSSYERGGIVAATSAELAAEARTALAGYTA